MTLHDCSFLLVQRVASCALSDAGPGRSQQHGFFQDDSLFCVVLLLVPTLRRLAGKASLTGWTVLLVLVCGRERSPKTLERPIGTKRAVILCVMIRHLSKLANSNLAKCCGSWQRGPGKHSAPDVFGQMLQSRGKPSSFLPTKIRSCFLVVREGWARQLCSAHHCFSLTHPACKWTWHEHPCGRPSVSLAFEPLHATMHCSCNARSHHQKLHACMCLFLVTLASQQLANSA